MVNSQSSMVNKTSVVFFGSGPYVVPVIEKLNAKFELVLVVTTETSGPVPSFCKSNNIPFISVSTLSEKIVNGQLSMVNCRVAVLASFGLIVPQSVLNMFEYGIINIHPSLLPVYRGPTPGQTAILDGKIKTGVSIIKLDSEVDHGPILAQEEAEIERDDTSDSLYKRLFEQGAHLLVRTLPKYISGELKPVEQDHSSATFTGHLTRESGFIDLAQDPKSKTQDLNRMIRAYHPWPGVWFRAKLNGIERIIKLVPMQNPPEADGPLAQIQVEGKNVMTFKDFINGYPEGKEILQRLNLK